LPELDCFPAEQVLRVVLALMVLMAWMGWTVLKDYYRLKVIDLVPEW
jgi:hypothetical protein